MEKTESGLYVDKLEALYEVVRPICEFVMDPRYQCVPDDRIVLLGAGADISMGDLRRIDAAFSACHEPMTDKQLEEYIASVESAVHRMVEREK